MYAPRIIVVVLTMSLLGCSRDESKEQQITQPDAVTRAVARKESAKSFIAQRVSSSMMVPGKVTECYVIPKTDNSFTFSGTFVWSQTGGKQRFNGEISGYGDSWKITSIKIQDHSMQ